MFIERNIYNSITYLCLGSIDLLFNSVKNSIVNTFQTLDGFLNESLFIISKNIDNKTGSF